MHIEARQRRDRRYGVDSSKIRNELGWYLENEDWLSKITDKAH